VFGGLSIDYVLNKVNDLSLVIVEIAHFVLIKVKFLQKITFCLHLVLVIFSDNAMNFWDWVIETVTIMRIFLSGVVVICNKF